MPVTPYVYDMTERTNEAIVNYVREGMSADYQARIPLATQDNMAEIGRLILDYQPHRNMFVDGLMNRIGLVIAQSKNFSNPLKFFKRGVLQFGETVEEYFVNMPHAQVFNPKQAARDLWKIEPPDIEAAFHSTNYRDFYKQSISEEMLRGAFTAPEGLYNMVSRVVDAMYSAAELDEFLLTKNAVSKAIDNGAVYPVTIEDITEDNSKSIAAIFRATSTKLTFPSSTYNALGVVNHTRREDQYLIMTADFDAAFDVNVLSAAFNMSYAEFLGHRLVIDEFPGHPEVKAVLCDKDFFMIFDKLFEFRENYNGQGLYWQYMLHVWKIYSVSPFANCVVFTTEANTLTGVTVNPDTADVAKGDNIKLTAEVGGTGIVPQGVYWTVSGAVEPTSYMGYNGILYVALDEPNTELTVTATSVVDGTKSGTATITIS